MDKEIINQPLETVLRERFRITTGFHPGQREIIEHLRLGRRVLAIQRTGWGKSLCYQITSLYYPNLTIVFSPLKALMRDQCNRCNSIYGIPAAIVSSDFTREENLVTLARAQAGELRILFIAPERLNNVDWQNSVMQMHINLIVVDEAHCISIWGHDFRPDYRRIKRLLNILPRRIPVLALTATANKRVEQDILEQIGPSTLVIRGTMHRSNLWLHVVPLSGDVAKLAYLATALPQWEGTGIIYTTTRAQAEVVASVLQGADIDAIYYHAGRDNSMRQEIEKALMQNKCKVICATNALGMGIDKADVRFVVHYNIPSSPIHYYQEMGRAGRDGKMARCVLLYDADDLTIQHHFIEHSKPAAQCYQSVYAYLRKAPAKLYDIMRQTGYTQSAVNTILKDMEELGIIERAGKSPILYTVTGPLDQQLLQSYDAIRQQKQHELEDMQTYATGQHCYMSYLTEYLGDKPGYRCGVCGVCAAEHFPLIVPTQRIQERVRYFLEEEYLPAIEKRGDKKPIHEAGWSLSYYSNTRIGRIIHACKYERVGQFPDEVVQRAVKVLRKRYPLDTINGIVSVPPTRSGNLVEMFARRVAATLHITYLPVIQKIRPTQEQKIFTNKVQKGDNVKNAFAVISPKLVNGRTLLLIDDIYDSGHTIRAIAQVLMKAGAVCIYPFTITRTLHSDDQ